MKIYKLVFWILYAGFSFGQDVSNSYPKFPFVNSNIKKYNNIKRDANDIPMLELKGKTFYYPVQYTQVALHYYANYLITKDPVVKESFLKQANFIKNAVTEYPNFSVWECNEAIPGYKLDMPWASSMAQGFGIGVMLQAYSITKDEEYLKVAQNAIQAYTVDLKDKGISNDWGGYDFYEEYADKDSHILNGYIFSLGGLYYHHQLIGDSLSKSLFDKGIKTLKAKIGEYDADFTSYYGKLHNGGYQYASAINNDPDHYHELVIYQLLTLFDWTNEILFYEYAHKFLMYDTGYVTDYYDKQKFSLIEASNTIDKENYGVDKLDDELWSWGKYWSTNRFPTELIIHFPEVAENIREIVFYSISESTLPEDFEVFICNISGEWVKVQSSEKIDNEYLRYFKTGNYETYIKGYKIDGNFNGTKLKVTFKGNKKNLITLREINVHYDRYKVLNKILNISKKNNLKSKN